MNYPEHLAPVERIKSVAADQLTDLLASRQTPLVFEGLLAGDLVEAGRAGALAQYCQPFDGHKPSVFFRLDASARGRIFYNADYTGFNFRREQADFFSLLQGLEQGRAELAHCYVGSSAVDYFLPGLKARINLDLAAFAPLVSLWFGGRTRVAAHFDLPSNLACVVAGRRRFTLFPPHQMANLYPGPLDLTPAGQPISLVDFYEPDFDRFPNYRKALAQAQVAELEPGDALFLPAMWWHQVEALDDFNVLLNYWWRTSPLWTGLPQDAISHALLAIGSLPEAERAAWAEVFHYYVIERERVSAQWPESVRGQLADVTPAGAKQLAAHLIQKLQRLL